MIVSDNPRRRPSVFGGEGVSVTGKTHTVGFWDSERRRAVHFGSIDPAKAVTVFPRPHRSV